VVSSAPAVLEGVPDDFPEGGVELAIDQLLSATSRDHTPMAFCLAIGKTVDVPTRMQAGRAF
jgi:hypothetical protein